MSDAKQAITIKKYANRRLYNTATSTYVTLGDLAKMVKEGIEFNVYDAKTSEDLTRSVLTQIIVEEEGKAGQNLLPISFLRQLIGFYGDNMQWMVPKYLEQSMQALSSNQEKIRGYFQNTFGSMFPFGSTLEEMSKQNMAMFERTLRMFAPFSGMSGTAGEAGAAKPGDSSAVEEQEAAAEAAFTPAANVTPMPTPATVQASTSTAPSGEEVQNKIAALQRQLADLAKHKG
jgi:polyhydroxyalkanoate synthesis repressor PhaR